MLSGDSQIMSYRFSMIIISLQNTIDMLERNMNCRHRVCWPLESQIPS